jgi:synaptobrevin family protein YKT6
LIRVQPLLVFSARTVTERTALNTRQSVQAEENVNGRKICIFLFIQFKKILLAIVHVYVRSDGLASVIVSDAEYPQRVAHTLLSKVSIHFI